MRFRDFLSSCRTMSDAAHTFRYDDISQHDNSLIYASLYKNNSLQWKFTTMIFRYSENSLQWRFKTMIFCYSDNLLQWRFNTLIFRYSDKLLQWRFTTLIFRYSDKSLQWRFTTLIFRYSDDSPLYILLPSPTRVFGSQFFTFYVRLSWRHFLYQAIVIALIRFAIGLWRKLSWKIRQLWDL